MATKKHSQRTSADKTTKARQTKVAKHEVAPPEITTQAEPVPIEAAEAPHSSTSETTTIDTPMPAEAATIRSEQTPVDERGKEKKLSALDAAALVLAESGQAMSCAELIAAMAAKGYWQSPKGKTPTATLYSAVLREIQTKGQKARFGKTARGKFALRKTE
jgi:hypothetical protein